MFRGGWYVVKLVLCSIDSEVVAAVSKIAASRFLKVQVSDFGYLISSLGSDQRPLLP